MTVYARNLWLGIWSKLSQLRQALLALDVDFHVDADERLIMSGRVAYSPLPGRNPVVARFTMGLAAGELQKSAVWGTLFLTEQRLAFRAARRVTDLGMSFDQPPWHFDFPLTDITGVCTARLGSQVSPALVCVQTRLGARSFLPVGEPRAAMWVATIENIRITTRYDAGKPGLESESGWPPTDERM